MILITALLLLAGDVESVPGKPTKPKLVCKTIQVTGTRLGGKRECRTKQNWEEYRRASEDDARKMQDASPLQPDTGG